MAIESGHVKRKDEHLRISLDEEVQFSGVTTGLEKYSFVHCALPELDLRNIDLRTEFLDKSLRAPLLISSMVGGSEAALQINRNLAEAAQVLGLSMGVGSERCLIEGHSSDVSFYVRDVAPGILLLANLGAVQLNYGFGPAECLQAVEAVGADALVLHLNPLQEALQPGGNTDFAGLLERIRAICHSLPLPVLVKEVGAGISESVACALAQAGIAGLDVAGAGGTCWSEIERRRAPDTYARSVADSFATWGIPTAESIVLARRGAPDVPIIASGGIRTGIDVAKSLALGADMAGIAMPLLKAAGESVESVIEYLRVVIETLRIAMFCTGSANIQELRKGSRLRRLIA